MDVFTYACWDSSKSLLAKGALEKVFCKTELPKNYAPTSHTVVFCCGLEEINLTHSQTHFGKKDFLL